MGLAPANGHLNSQFINRLQFYLTKNVMFYREVDGGYLAPFTELRISPVVTGHLYRHSFSP